MDNPAYFTLFDEDYKERKGKLQAVQNNQIIR